MFGTIRKHQTWLWVVLIAIMSVSLVVFFTDPSRSPSGGLFGGKGAADFGSMDGRPFTQSEYYDALKELKLSHFIRSSRWPGNDENTSRTLERDTISRLFLLNKLKQMDIHASLKAVGLMMEEQIRDIPLAKFEADYLRLGGLTAADYKRFLEHEVEIRQLIAAAAVSAKLVTPQEAESFYRKENQEVASRLAVFWASNYLDQVAVTNGAIENYFSNRAALYRIPERAVLAYVAFTPSNYFAEAEIELKKNTNINEIVDKYYFEKGTNEWKGTNGMVLSETEAKKKILDDIRLNFALTAARRAAAEFGTELMNQPEANKAANLERVAAAKGLPVKATKPFDHKIGLEEFAGESGVGPRAEESFADILRERARNLTPDKPILFSPVPSSKGVYLIAFKEMVRGEMPPLEKVRDQVTKDYKNAFALNMALQAGRSFHTVLTNGLAQKKSFDELCAASKVKVLDPPLFSPATRTLTNLDSRINLAMLQKLANDLDPGQASNFTTLNDGGAIHDGGLILYLQARPPIDEAKMRADMPEFLGRLRAYRQNEAFNAWFRRQAELARLQPPKREASVSAAN